jgi:DNA-binding NtrC family response regulator
MILIMNRPCFIVADRNFSGNISTRKLVIETAKLNVLTSYSGSETVRTLERFPNVDGIVMDSTVDDIPLEILIAQLKKLQPNIPVILIRSPGTSGSPSADYQIESFQPGPLLDLLQKLRPKETNAIEKEDERLAGEDS